MEPIKTTQEKAVAAYKAINELRQKVKGKEALGLFHMKRVLQEHVDFMVEEEDRLFNEYGGKMLPGNLVVIENPEKRAEFQKAYKALLQTECEVKEEPVEISMEKNPDISLEQIEVLDGFVNFI